MWMETMNIKDLFGELERSGRVVVPGLHDREVTGLSIDSRQVRPGDLFAALAGRKSDGHRFTAAAAAAGAAALLVEKGRVDPGAAGVLDVCHGDDRSPTISRLAFGKEVEVLGAERADGHSHAGLVYCLVAAHGPAHTEAGNDARLGER